MNGSVLLVEDDRWMGECYLAWLLGFGYDVDWVQDSQAELDVLDEKKFSLIVLDIMLPFANGLHLLNVLASHADLGSIPVVICSSMAPEGLQERYGVRAVLDKAQLTPKLMQSALVGAMGNAPV
jgi:CheY-like chemotaxis protein